MRKGFRIDEEMAGHHELEPGFGPSGRLPMSFRATWGVDDARSLLKSRRLALSGRVTVGGLVEDAPISGDLDLRYDEGRIRYAFNFDAGGQIHRFVGEKVNIKPWNLLTSHTTCFGRITLAESGQLVSTSVLLFRLAKLPALLTSFRLT